MQTMVKIQAPIVDVESASSSSDESEAEWCTIPVSKSKARGHHVNQVGPTPQADVETARAAISRAVEVLSVVLDRESFWERYGSYFPESLECVVRGYGIGSPSNSNVSCFQIAMLILIMKRVKAKQIWCFDPVMNETDLDIISSYGIQTKLRDEETEDQRLDLPIILFMPHCDRSLYEWTIGTRFPVLPSGSFFVSNWFSAYTVQHEGWDKVVEYFNMEPFLVFSKDYERIVDGCMKPKRNTAEKSEEVPYQAFNDLAFVKPNDQKSANTTSIFIKTRQP